jgi:micrococcal nuclease
MQRKLKPTIYRVFIAAALLSLLAASLSAAASELREARIIAVNDGDTVTLVMQGKKYRTRLIGIDAPEMGQEPWGRTARAYLRTILKAEHWNVLVETDVEHYDKYNRLLVYLWSKDKKLINEMMVRDGYAVTYPFKLNSRYRDRFKKAERSAQEKHIGIWGPDGLKETPLEYKKKHPR